MPVSYKAEVIADASGVWVSNLLRFRTRAEAATYADDLGRRWTLVRESRVVASEDEVNAAMEDYKLIHFL